MKTLGFLVILAIVQSVFSSEPDMVTIYMNSRCQGSEYKLLVDRGRCIDLPNWISLRESHMSINPEGYCLRMFETNQCKISIVRGTKRPVEFNKCRNPNQMGMSSFRSFIIVPC